MWLRLVIRLAVPKKTGRGADRRLRRFSQSPISRWGWFLRKFATVAIHSASASLPPSQSAIAGVLDVDSWFTSVGEISTSSTVLHCLRRIRQRRGA